VRFVVHTWRFRTEQHGDVVIHYAPSLVLAATENRKTSQASC
jgi:hypothetical protein